LTGWEWEPVSTGKVQSGAVRSFSKGKYRSQQTGRSKKKDRDKQTSLGNFASKKGS